MILCHFASFWNVCTDSLPWLEIFYAHVTSLIDLIKPVGKLGFLRVSHPNKQQISKMGGLQGHLQIFKLGLQSIFQKCTG